MVLGSLLNGMNWCVFIGLGKRVFTVDVNHVCNPTTKIPNSRAQNPLKFQPNILKNHFYKHQESKFDCITVISKLGKGPSQIQQHKNSKPQINLPTNARQQSVTLSMFVKDCCLTIKMKLNFQIRFACVFIIGAH